jgi:hypothetical protein
MTKRKEIQRDTVEEYLSGAANKPLEGDHRIRDMLLEGASNLTQLCIDTFEKQNEVGHAGNALLEYMKSDLNIPEEARTNLGKYFEVVNGFIKSVMIGIRKSSDEIDTARNLACELDPGPAYNSDEDREAYEAWGHSFDPPPEFS